MRLKKKLTTPANWRLTTLENVAEIIMGQSPKGDSTTNNSKYTPLIGGAADIGALFPKISRYTKTPTKLSSSDDIIICVRATLGKPIFSNGVYCLGRGVAAIRPRTVLKEFLRYAFINFKQYLYDNAAGSTFLQIPSAKLKIFPIPLPPLEEQKRIAALLDSLFEKLDAAKNIVQKISDGYELRRAAILYRAFTGKLTENFRAEHALTLDDWQEKTLGEICKLVQGEKLLGKNFPYLEVKYLRGVKVAKIVDSGKFISAGTKIILVDGENSSEIFTAPEDGYLGSTFRALQIADNVDADYFQYFVSTKKELYHSKKRGSAIPHLDKKIFNSTPINLPPLEEQKEIVCILEKLLTNEQRTKGIAENFLHQIDTLKKNILARAFRGELGTNNPNESV